MHNQLRLIYLIRNLGDDDFYAVAVVLDFGAGARDDLAVASLVRLPNSHTAHNDTARWEVGGLYIGHQLVNLDVGIVNQRNYAVDNFAKVVRWNRGRHTYGNTVSTIYQKVREARGQNHGLLQGVVEVRAEVHRVLVDIAEHFGGDFTKARLCVTLCSGGVPVDTTKVSLAFDKGCTHGKGLSQTHKCIVNCRVAVRVILTQNVADNTRALTVRLVIK